MIPQHKVTSGLFAGAPTPRAAFADNDLALGRLVEALSRSVYWKNTVVFVVEDDAQNGPDHVDSHRSVMFAISANSRGGVRHRFANTSDVLATIIEVLHLGSLSQFDFYGRPLRDVFTDSADLAPYAAIVPPSFMVASSSARNSRETESIFWLSALYVDKSYRPDATSSLIISSTIGRAGTGFAALTA